MSDSNSSTTWKYNVLGQVTSETHTIESTNYSITTTFDAFSRPLTQTVPSQGSTETLSYSYNNMGALSSLVGTNTYVSQIHYAASGQVNDQLLGNNLIQQSCYNANTLRLTGLRVYSGTLQTCGTTPVSPRLNLSYAHQNNGNIQQIMDVTRSETLNYTYDELDRLDTVSGPYSQNYDYNTIGNITNKDTTTYTYGDLAHKHAVTSLSGSGGTYTYDANGNMITRVEGGLTYTQTFDAENRLKSVAVSGQTTQFIYDGDGNLVKKIKPDGSKTIYVGGIYEVDKTSGGSVTRTVTYYPAAGAMRINSTLYYVLKDHLGSASVITDASGNILGENRYYPFGETRLTTGTILTDKLFTGQREMAGLGIYHFNARFYSPKLGRFLSADTIVPGYANPQSLNRYSYVLGNPLKYIDPTGHRVCDDVDSAGNCITAPGSPAGSGGSPNPPDKPEFENLPIDPADINGVQWFGGTLNAYELTSYSNIYQYCHDFHCGLDILAPFGATVTAGVYGKVIYAGCAEGNFEGPCKVQVEVGEYVITYGHLAGMPEVARGLVNPSTVLGGVGSNSHNPNDPNFPDPNAGFTHIHLEVRGPGGWYGGPSVNPLLFMKDEDVAALVDIASNQTIEPQMAVFSDGNTTYSYPPPNYLMPNQIWRTTGDNSYFP